MKTIYYATHKNISGNEQIRIDRCIDALENISFQVILQGSYTPDNKFERVIGLYDNINEAKELADNYSTE